ncbi:homeobox protein Mohawk isoform X2 [Anabrus simplex]|uniref:homeobox protein Mohawk isoform X2 n=1 Tax=Anabrus simplex TaxID=316456 RepID=UPI0035A39F2F
MSTFPMLSEDSGLIRSRLRKGEKPRRSEEEPTSDNKERWLQGGRVLRSRRYRRPFEDHRHTKRLFTPEIKRFLKGWLVRRRDNPYPNRDEKKGLAVQTGLTYIQICNWFANWRRKLKNAGSEARQRTWGNLIKSYNTQAQGNVEQFSICSDDSIWEEEELLSDTEQSKVADISSSPSALSYTVNATAMDHSYSALVRRQGEEDNEVNSKEQPQAQCSQISSTTAEEEPSPSLPSAPASTKYKSHMMEKYLRDLEVTGSSDDSASGRRSKRQKKETCPPLLLSKWLESAARYQPGQSYVTWSAKNVTWRSPTTKDTKKSRRWNVSGVESPSVDSTGFWSASGHHREELDAAVALTCLSGLQH